MVPDYVLGRSQVPHSKTVAGRLGLPRSNSEDLAAFVPVYFSNGVYFLGTFADNLVFLAGQPFPHFLNVLLDLLQQLHSFVHLVVELDRGRGVGETGHFEELVIVVGVP